MPSAARPRKPPKPAGGEAPVGAAVPRPVRDRRPLRARGRARRGAAREGPRRRAAGGVGGRRAPARGARAARPATCAAWSRRRASAQLLAERELEKLEAAVGEERAGEARRVGRERGPHRRPAGGASRRGGRRRRRARGAAGSCARAPSGSSRRRRRCCPRRASPRRWPRRGAPARHSARRDVVEPDLRWPDAPEARHGTGELREGGRGPGRLPRAARRGAGARRARVPGRRARPARDGGERRRLRRARRAVRLAVGADGAARWLLRACCQLRSSASCWSRRRSGGADLRVLAASARAAGLQPRGGPLPRRGGPRRHRARRARERAERSGRGGGARRAYAAEVAQIHAGYRAALERLGLVDRELFAWRTLDAFRENPGAWGATPVFVYGFDDFTDVELAGIEALAEHVDVTLSFPYERGRHAFDALTETFERLAGAGGRARRAGGRAGPLRARVARPALHHLERRLFDPAGERVRRRDGRAPPLGRRRARRGRAGRGLRPRAARRGNAGGRHRGRLPQPRALRVAGRPGVLRLRHPVLARPPGAARPHGARPRPARAAALRLARALRHDGRPPHLPALARPARRAGPRRQARGQGAPGGRARRRRGARSSGRADNAKLAADRDRRAARCGGRPGDAAGGARAAGGVAVLAPVPAPGARVRPRRGGHAADVRGRPRRARPDARARQRGSHGASAARRAAAT